MIRPASFRILGPALLAASLLAPAAQAQTPATAMNGMLVGPNQMTLYVFDKDPEGSGKSVCNGGCAANWPPLMAAAEDTAAGDWRSEEHTSELQSRENLVCRLLLEKKQINH